MSKIAHPVNYIAYRKKKALWLLQIGNLNLNLCEIDEPKLETPLKPPQSG